MSINLADLPPEIVQRVFAELVRGQPFQQIWRYRKISRLFHTYIPREILGRQPVAAYSISDNVQFIRRHFGLYLEYRMSALYGAPDDLPNVLKKIVAVIASVSDDPSSTKRAVWTQAACHTVATYRQHQIPTIWTLALDPDDDVKIYLAGISGEIEALVVSVVLGDQDLVRRLLALGISMWANIPLISKWSCAFEVAVQWKDLAMINLMLACGNSINCSKEKRKRTITFRRCVFSGIFDSDELATELFRWYMANINHRSDAAKSAMSFWLEQACQRGRIGFISEVLDHARGEARSEYRDLLLSHWRSFTALKEIVRLFLEKGFFDRQSVNIDQSVAEPVWKKPLLDIVVSMGDIDLVWAVLDIGAHPDGVRLHDGKLSYPLMTAVEQSRDDIMHKLIMRGADPEAGERKTGWQQMTLSEPMDGIEIQKEISETIARFHRPMKLPFEDGAV